MKKELFTGSEILKTKRALRLGILEDRFLEAAEQSNFNEIVRCIAVGVDPNCTSEDTKFTALHTAAEKGDLNITLKLLKCENINIHPITRHGYMPLHIACNFNHLNVAACLLKYGADPNAVTHLNQTSLHLAALSRSILIVELLFKYGARVDIVDGMYRTPFYISVIERPFLTLAKLFVKHKANINMCPLNMPFFLEAVNVCHTSRQLKVVEFFIQHGVNINVCDKISKRNALHFVAVSGYLPLLGVLMKEGVDIEKEDFMQKKPVDLAIFHRNWKVVYAITKFKENPDEFSIESLSI